MGIPEWIEGMLKDGQFRSIYDMALKLEAPQPTVHRWRRGQSVPSIPYCIKLAAATGTPLEEIVRMAGVDEEMPPASEEQTASQTV